MIRITRMGQETKVFYSNVKSPCFKCGCVFECDTDDMEKAVKELAEGDDVMMCPCCGSLVTMTRYEMLVDMKSVAMDKRVDDLDFSVRTQNCLRIMNVRTVKDLVACTPRRLLSSNMFGRKSLKEVEDKLGDMGLSLSKDEA